MQSYILKQFFCNKICNFKLIELLVLCSMSFALLVGVNTGAVAMYQPIYLLHGVYDSQITLNEQKRLCEANISKEEKYLNKIKTVTEPGIKYIESDSEDLADNQ